LQSRSIIGSIGDNKKCNKTQQSNIFGFCNWQAPNAYLAIKKR